MVQRRVVVTGVGVISGLGLDKQTFWNALSQGVSGIRPMQLVDRTLLRENLKLTEEQRIRKAQSFHRSIEDWREAGRELRREEGP